MKVLALMVLFGASQASDRTDYQNAVAESIRTNRKQTIIDLSRRLLVINDDLQDVEYLLSQPDPIDELRKLNETLTKDKLNLEWLLKGMHKR